MHFRKPASMYQDHLEYHGSTTVERVRKLGDIVVRRDWILFDSIEEAMEYFISHR